jgi:hypothetical protein
LAQSTTTKKGRYLDLVSLKIRKGSIQWIPGRVKNKKAKAIYSLL